MIHKLKLMHLINMQDKKIKKKLLNFYILKQKTVIQIHVIYNRKSKVFEHLGYPTVV